MEHLPPSIERAGPWWRHAVIYQIYIRSFADANGDGRGDLAGIRSRLDYLVRLGIDGLWLNPCYPSPQEDHGYDVADYFDIEPEYGSLSDFDNLLRECHDRGLKLLMDVVPNHCSSDHEWFQRAVAGGPGSAERELFWFRDGKGADGSKPPNNWEASFGGSAWSRVTEPDGSAGQWYLHLFTPGQPDFNWSNPLVLQMFDDMLRFWFDRGVDGFRIDVAHGLAKDPELPDSVGCIDHGLFAGSQDIPGAWDRQEVHNIWRRWRAVADEYKDRTLIGEVWVDSQEKLSRYVRSDELHQVFHFDLVLAQFDAAEWRAVIEAGLERFIPIGAPITWVLSNHDVWRHVTRFGDGLLGQARSRAAILALLGLPGSTYLYAGEELGLPEVRDLPDEARQDPVWERSGHTNPGRDGCRVPLPWTRGGSSYGFGPDGTTAPWLPQPDGWGSFAVEDQAARPDSMLSLYRRVLAVRRCCTSMGDGPFEWVDAPQGCLAWRRGDITVAVNFSDTPVPFDEGGEVLVSSGPLPRGVLPACSSAWWK